MPQHDEHEAPDEAEDFVRRLHAEHGSALYAWALRRLGNPHDAEEAVAETLVKAWRHHDRFDPRRGSERGWLFAILRNTAVDTHRRNRAHLRLVEGGAEPESDDPGFDAIAESAIVREAMMELSENHREAIMEAYFAGRTVAQIAERHGIPPGTVKSRLYYGMRSLRTALEERGILE